MNEIQMVDLKTQYQSIKTEIDAAIQKVLTNAQFIHGEQVVDFEKKLAEYLNVKHVITCANGTDALQIALMALNLSQGDEIITPSFTYIATTEVIALLGLKPVFVDVNKDTFCIDETKIEQAITSRTKAIVPVHLYGQAANMDVIMNIAKKYNLTVIEDNAQAIGSTYQYENRKTAKTGTIGTIGCTSFFPSKNLGCYGDGGAMCTNDDQIATKLRMIANHGQSKRYYHDIVGCNSRLDSIQAAVLNVKLPYLEKYNNKRREVADYYDSFFEDFDELQTPFRNDFSTHVFHQYTLILNGIQRDELHKYLSDKKVPSMIYYPVPAHRQKMFENFNSKELNLPITDWLTERVISLPIHTEMTQEQQSFICETIAGFIKNNKK